MYLNSVFMICCFSTHGSIKNKKEDQMIQFTPPYTYTIHKKTHTYTTIIEIQLQSHAQLLLL